VSTPTEQRPWYVYAIVGANAKLLEPRTGFGDQALSLIHHRALAAVASPLICASAHHAASPEQLLEHEAIVERICQGAPALPAQFLTVLPDAAAIENALAARYDELKADLKRIEDRVEFGLLVSRAANPSETEGRPRQRFAADAGSFGGGPGARYLAERSLELGQGGTREKVRELKHELESTLHGKIVESRYFSFSAHEHGLALKAAYLVAPACIDAFRKALAQIRTKHRLRCVLSGPWPPYSFVSSNAGIQRLGTSLHSPPAIGL
jgi:hypothetical protein